MRPPRCTGLPARACLQDASLELPAVSLPAVLVALREAVLSLEEMAVSAADAAAVAAHPDCCIAFGLLNGYPYCPTNINCPIPGWNTQRRMRHCLWQGVTCDAGGSVTHL